MDVQLPLSDIEQRVVRRALNLLRAKSRKQMERDKERGWTPDPDRIDIHAATIETIERLCDRLNTMNPRESS